MEACVSSKGPGHGGGQAVQILPAKLCIVFIDCGCDDQQIVRVGADLNGQVEVRAVRCVQSKWNVVALEQGEFTGLTQLEAHEVIVWRNGVSSCPDAEGFTWIALIVSIIVGDNGHPFSMGQRGCDLDPR